MDKRKRILNRDINDPPGSFRFCLVPSCNSQGKDMYGGFCGRHRNRAAELPVPYPGEGMSKSDQDGFVLSREKINWLQVGTIKRLILRAKQAHVINVRIRINGKWEEYEADWIKHMRPAKEKDGG